MEDCSLFDQMDETYIVCGADEAGRGPLAGPVVAAAVILPEDFPFEILGDSKSLTEKERLYAERIIKEKAVSYGITAVSHAVIDKINILNASMLAMAESYRKAARKAKPDILLVDGNKCPSVDIPVKAIVKGDAKISEIMAASILAKTERDRLMELADLKWPQYGYRKHKGYPTKLHYEAIEKYGPSPICRMSFRLYRKDKMNEEPVLL